MKAGNRVGGAGWRWGRCAVTAVLCLFAGLAHSDPQRDALAQARHDLAISEQVLARLSARVDAARRNPATSPGERARLDDYLARVRALVSANRARVRDLEQPDLAQPAGAGGEPGRIPPTGAATEAERVARLDGKLDDSLEAFDKLLLDEARKARTRGAAESASPDGAGGAPGARTGKRNGTGRAGKSGEGESSRAGKEAGETNEAAGERTSRDGPRSASQDGSAGGPVGGHDTDGAGPQAARTASTPPDVGDGSDDDIVARQIRRAAEAEPDPELRAKLWDEYRKYKQGLSTGASG